MNNLNILLSLIELTVKAKEESGVETMEYARLRDFIQEMMDTLLPSPANTLTADEILVGRYEGKINAIKLYKNRTQRPLIDCKRFVEEYFHKHNFIFKGYSA